MSSLLGDFLLGTDVLSGSAGTLADLITQTGSNPTWLRNDTFGNARAISVELALPQDGGSILGEMILGSSVLSGLDWYPVTGRWTGASFDRGDPSSDLPQVGVMQLTLDNSDGMLSPWTGAFPRNASAYAGPGTLVRLSVFNGLLGQWYCLFTGLTESWNVTFDALRQLSEVDLTVVETTTILGQINDNALPGVVGGGEYTVSRVQRLLDASGWQFGLVGYGGNTTTHQSTDMASNRLAELYLTADSGAYGTTQRMRFRADRTGAAYLGPETRSSWTLHAGRYVTEGTLQINNDGTLILNAVSLAVAGGSSTTYERSASIGRYGRHSTQRYDLNATVGTDLTTIASSMLNKGAVTLRPTSFELDSTRDPYAPSYLDLSIGVTVVDADGNTFSGFRVAALHVDIRPLGADDVDWTTTVSLLPV